MYKSLLLNLTIIFLFTLNSCIESKSTDKNPPNVVLIFLDDAGWGDFEPFQKNYYETPNVKKLAEDGRAFHNFYVPQAICSASRASLLTGCYPERTQVFSALAPKQRGLDPKYATLAEMLQQKGYKTGIFGKWHLGDVPETRPAQRGFDESAGIMYSNDMWAFHPQNPEYWGQFPLRYYENGKVTIDSVTPDHQPHFTTWFTEKAVGFINRHKDKPFFLYVPHPQPHVPLFVSDKFKGKSGTGLYGDVIMELDWSVGQIMQALKDNGLEENTLVIFTSDNGPWLSYGNHAGKTPYRGEKGTSFDGGVRSSLIIKYPIEIEGNTLSHAMFMTIDILPTIAHLTGAELPNMEVDGKNVWNLITGTDTINPHEYYAFTTGQNFEGIISANGKWKLHLPHNYRDLTKGGKDGIPAPYFQNKIDTALFDMVHDPFEKLNVLHQYPEVAEKLLKHANDHQDKFFGVQ